MNERHQVELFMPHPVERVTEPLILIRRNINIDRTTVLHPLSLNLCSRRRKKGEKSVDHCNC